MAKQSNRCQKPDQLKGKPEECTPEQIRKCHGSASHHPCVGNKPGAKGRGAKK